MGKVLFLDIDGVVLSGQDLWSAGNNRYLPPAKIAMVKEVCDRAGAVVVVSSTWRYSDATRDMLIHEGLILHTDWRTPRARKEGLLLISKERGGEIDLWLRDHPEIGCYAIVDDDRDMLPEQLPRFVRTPHETGLDRQHVEALVMILSTPFVPALSSFVPLGEAKPSSAELPLQAHPKPDTAR